MNSMWRRLCWKKEMSAGTQTCWNTLFILIKCIYLPKTLSTTLSLTLRINERSVRSLLIAAATRSKIFKHILSPRLWQQSNQSSPRSLTRFWDLHCENQMSFVEKRCLMLWIKVMSSSNCLLWSWFTGFLRHKETTRPTSRESTRSASITVSLSEPWIVGSSVLKLRRYVFLGRWMSWQTSWATTPNATRQTCLLRLQTSRRSWTAITLWRKQSKGQSSLQRWIKSLHQSVQRNLRHKRSFTKSSLYTLKKSLRSSTRMKAKVAT